LVGVETARTLSYAWKIPLVAVNHIEGHIRANFINHPQTPPLKGGGRTTPNPSLKRRGDLPAIILTVSGGHTMLVLLDKKNKFKIIGETRDDAAGEAFDKAAKLLNLGYPGGPIVSKVAAEFAITHPLRLRSGQAVSRGAIHPSREGIILPRPIFNEKNFDFSFSGLKTALLYKIQKDENWKNRVPEYCYEFERAVVETLVGKTVKAANKYGVKTMMLAGGVAANLALREEFQNAAAKLGLACQIPPQEYTTDNAAMIAAAGYFLARQKDFTPWQKLKADSNLELK
jgi:N6-L-threonylcarbamoyladenine synthase